MYTFESKILISMISESDHKRSAQDKTLTPLPATILSNKKWFYKTCYQGAPQYKVLNS